MKPAALIALTAVDWKAADAFWENLGWAGLLDKKDDKKQTEISAWNRCLGEQFGAMALQAFSAAFLVECQDSRVMESMLIYGITYGQPISGNNVYLCFGPVAAWAAFIQVSGLRGKPLEARKLCIALYLELQPHAKELFTLTPSKNGWMEP